MIFSVLKRGPPSTHTARASPVSRLEEELGDFLGSVLGRVGGSGLASLNLPTFYLRLPVASWGVGLSGRPLPLSPCSLSLCWDRYALSVLSHSVRSAFGRYALPLRCVCVLLSLLVLSSWCVLLSSSLSSSRCVFVVACFLRLPSLVHSLSLSRLLLSSGLSL